MSEVLIKFDNGYEPQFESYTVHFDGDVCVCGTDEVIGHAIKLPPHGRLGDLDALEEQAFDDGSYLLIHNAPTIIEASEEK